MGHGTLALRCHDDVDVAGGHGLQGPLGPGRIGGVDGGGDACGDDGDQRCSTCGHRNLAVQAQSAEIQGALAMQQMATDSERADYKTQADVARMDKIAKARAKAKPKVDA
jgi:hypothetical protein